MPETRRQSKRRRTLSQQPEQHPLSASASSLLLDSLPEELLLLVLRFLEPHDVARVAVACRRLAVLARDEGMWQHRVSRLLALPSDQLPKPSLPVSWREYWMRLALPPVRNAPVPRSLPLSRRHRAHVVTLGGCVFILADDHLSKFKPTRDGCWHLIANVDIQYDEGLAGVPHESSFYDLGHFLVVGAFNDERYAYVVLDQDLLEIGFQSQPRRELDILLPLGAGILSWSGKTAGPLRWLRGRNAFVSTDYMLPAPAYHPGLTAVTKDQVAGLLVQSDVRSQWAYVPYPLSRPDTGTSIMLHRLGKDLQLLSATPIDIPLMDSSTTATELCVIEERLLLLSTVMHVRPSRGVRAVEVRSLDSGRRVTIGFECSSVNAIRARFEAANGLLYCVLTAPDERSAFVFCFNSAASVVWNMPLAVGGGLRLARVMPLSDASLLLELAAPDCRFEYRLQKR